MEHPPDREDLKKYWDATKNIFDLWNIKEEERHALFFVGKDAYDGWAERGAFPEDIEVLIRASWYARIYKLLQITLPKEESADQWFTRPNTIPFLSGKSAKEAILENEDMLRQIGEYLGVEAGD